MESAGKRAFNGLAVVSFGEKSEKNDEKKRKRKEEEKEERPCFVVKKTTSRSSFIVNPPIGTCSSGRLERAEAESMEKRGQ